jgi:tripartite-type tricarboxylate transporter receptor subunit TctC
MTHHRITATRRRALLGAAALAGQSRPSLAQQAAAWPIRQTRLVVPFAAGSVLDIPARILADRLSRRLGATFIVENKPGAGGGIGTMEVVRAAPDGGTLLVGSSSITILPFLQPRLGLDPVRDLVPVSILMDLPVAASVRPSSPIKDTADLIARARAEPGRITYGSGGVGSSVHLTTALFASMAGIELLHVPYGGGARAMTALYAGEIDVFFTSTVDQLPAARQGLMRLIGVATERRMPEVPDVPAINEVVPGYTMLQWVAMWAPRGLPAPLVERLVAELALLQEDAELKSRLAVGAAPVRFDGPAPLAERITQELATWRTVIARENIRPE